MTNHYKELLEETMKMRTLQKQYFKTRQITDLEVSKAQEKKVDKLIVEIKISQTKMDLL